MASLANGLGAQIGVFRGMPQVADNTQRNKGTGQQNVLLTLVYQRVFFLFFVAPLSKGKEVLTIPTPQDFHYKASDSYDFGTRG